MLLLFTVNFKKKIMMNRKKKIKETLKKKAKKANAKQQKNLNSNKKPKYISKAERARLAEETSENKNAE